MSDWEIQMLYPDEIGTETIQKILYILISNDVKYNIGEYKGAYHIVSSIDDSVETKSQEDNIIDGECTERLAEFIQDFEQMSEEGLQTSVSLALETVQGPIHFSFKTRPSEENNTLVLFSVNEDEIGSKDDYYTFIDLTKSVFERLDFVYGAYRSEWADQIPASITQVAQEPLQSITLLSKELAEKIEVRRLRTAYFQRFEELNDGGVLLVLCNEPTGCENVVKANEILNLSS